MADQIWLPIKAQCGNRDVRLKLATYCKHADPTQVRGIKRQIMAVRGKVAERQAHGFPVTADLKSRPKRLPGFGKLAGSQANLVGFLVTKHSNSIPVQWLASNGVSSLFKSNAIWTNPPLLSSDT